MSRKTALVAKWANSSHEALLVGIDQPPQPADQGPLFLRSALASAVDGDAEGRPVRRRPIAEDLGLLGQVAEEVSIIARDLR